MNSSENWKEYYKSNNNNKPFVPESFIARCFLSTRPISLLKNYDFANKKLLDVGCGDGRHIVFFKNLGFDVTGVEIGEEKVSQLKEKFKDSKFYQGTSSNLPFETNRFDYVVAVNSIYYLNSNDTLENNISSCADVLKQDGILVASFVGHKHFVLTGSFQDNQNSIINSVGHQCNSGIKIRAINSKTELKSITEENNLLKVRMIGEIQDELLGQNRHLYYLTAQKI